MIRRVLIFLILVNHAVSDYCERYTFEQNFDEWLLNEWGGACLSMSFWVVGMYSDLDLTGQNELSTSFITPQSELSCVSSFIFSMNVGGTIEVNIYMEATDPSDQVIIMANLVDVTGDRITGMETHSASDPSFVNGWHTLTMTLTGSVTYDGYISIMGMAAPESIVLVDSFRYIPPGMDESECQLYEVIPTPDPTTTPTPDPTTTPTPDPTTPPTPDPTTTPTTDPITIPSPDPTTTPTPEQITIPNTPDPTTTPTTTSMDTTQTENDSDDTDATTPYPCPTLPIDNEDTKSFWTPLTITMLVLLYLIVLALVCLLFYEIGRRRAKTAAAANDLDFESVPSSFKVPRIKTVYPDANNNPYARRNSM